MMITTINEFKLVLESLSNDELLNKVQELNYSTELIFGKFGTLEMCDGKNFYDNAIGRIDPFIDALPTKTIPMDNVYPTQLSISYNAFKDKLTGSPKDENDLPFVIHNKLGYFIFDGHHRLSLAKLRGDKYAKAKVFEDL